MSEPAAYKKPMVWVVSLVGWSLIGLLNALSETIDLITGDASHALWEPVCWELTSNLTFALITPFLVELALRVRFSRTGRLRTIIGHLLVIPLFSLTHVAGMVGLRKGIYTLLGQTYDFGKPGWEMLYEGAKDLTTYAILIGLTYGFDYFRRSREQELRASRLEAGLTRARLENLEHRIQPHFLFNTLNMISATMHDDLDQADRMITRLSDLLRISVRRNGRPEISLDQELELLDAYVEIMKARFEGRLKVTLEIEAKARRAHVPPLLLQPLVENAIKHGTSRSQGCMRIRVTAGLEEEQLILRVADNGPGSTESEERLMEKGLGLSTTAERLTRLYGPDHGLVIRNEPEGGLSVTMRIPAKSAKNEND